jgi:hypothetical protein
MTEPRQGPFHAERGILDERRKLICAQASRPGGS